MWMIVLYWRGKGRGEKFVLEQIIIPLLLYEVLVGLFPICFPGMGTLEAVTVGNLLSVPVLYYWVVRYGNGKKLSLCWKKRGNDRKQILYLLMAGISASILLNHFLLISGLYQMFPSVFQIQERIYTSPFWLQILGSGLMIPLAEELVYRGILYENMKEYLGVRTAAVWSALIFGIMHGNVIQGIYAGLMGLVLAWVYETCGFFLAPVMVHIAANISSVSGSYWLEQKGGFCPGISFYMITAIMAAAAVWSAAGIKNRR